MLQRPDHAGSFTSFPDEQWFFINGILTTDTVAQLNAAFLADLFHRPITLVQNATSSLASDLLECAIGKQWYRTTEAVVTAFPLIYDALAGAKSRIVVIAHSQGTIIAAVILRLLAALTSPPRARSVATARGRRPAEPVFIYPDDAPLDLSDFDPLTPDQLARLEVYAFANCATTMRYWRAPQDGAPGIPWIESYGNEFDLVARLGMLAPNAGAHGIAIDGPRYRRPGAWGHLLNEHYLAPIEHAQRRGRRRGGRGGTVPFERVNDRADSGAVAPRLFGYLNGGLPAD